MSLNTNLDNLISTALKSNGVATIAGITNPLWQNSHVFDSIGGYVGPKNRGRLPFIEYGRVRSDYFSQQVGAVENSQGGSVTTNWTFIVHVGKTSRLNESTNEDYGYKIAEVAIATIRTANINCRLGNEQILQLDSSPFGFSIQVNFSIDNSWSEDLRIAP